MTQVLVVEDEPGIASFVAKGLRAAGMQPTAVGTGRDAIDHAVTGGYDIIVLDIGLPDIDGFQVLERLRGSGCTTPVIILTARTSVDDTVLGLEGGADDYMPKPFRFEELLARIRLRLRAVAAQAAENSPQLIHNGITLDPITRRVTVDGSEVELSAREFALLETFMRHPGHVLSREQLLSRVWGYDFDPNSNVVDVYVRYVRQKIGADRLRTVRGVGYRLG
ncbi:response regulator transcription factor [Tessaracoccus caeni]|uniref:response regulator transcription factor n=1 Tax=Tessaracoccus caeni TaxID=3031239 RepID=UPI0023DAE8B6|nr:response regulator transcription factor [Tessaracoccus caeni]MDF1488201.1 response regulator transcription factor [Tessaracoccus caeni]